MRRAWTLLPLLALWWTGCAASVAPVEPPPLLNSERIAQTFGSYGLDVLEDTDTLRVSNLYSVHDGRKVGRTFAVVRYARPLDARVRAEHAQITAGGSIGAVFKAAGWTLQKRHRYVGAIPVEPAFERVQKLMGPFEAPALAVHVYDLVVERPGVLIPYATLAEVHHPAYLAAADLQAIYGPVPTEPTAAVRSVLATALREMAEP